MADSRGGNGKHIIGRHVFRTKDEAAEFARKILYRYRDFPNLIIRDGGDYEDLTAFLDRHSSKEIKVGTGVAGFSVSLNRWGKPHFVVHRTDGTTTDFSYVECLTPVPPRRKFAMALRRHVAQDILVARDAYLARSGGRITCAETGAQLSLGSQTHIDHRPPNTFEAIVAAFERVQGITDHEILLDEHLDGDLEHRVRDLVLVERFRAFHRERAELDFVSSEVNLRRQHSNRHLPPHITLREFYQ